MLRLIPAPLHRLLLRIAYRLRHRWRKATGRRLSGVSVLALDLEGRLLLVRHSYGPTSWCLPAGGMNRGEKPEDAACRELAEETGCTLQNPHVIEAIEEIVSGAPHTGYLVTGRTIDRPVPDCREVIEAKFFPVHSLPEPQTPLTRKRIAAWKERKG
ncbi:NUDIX domain-containing protein [Tsuneonella sp. HG249]